MASRPWPALVLLLLVVSTGLAPSVQAQSSGDDGELLDVRVFTSECLQNATCEATKPDHLIEYFSADWCEPCVEVGDQLNGIRSEKTVVLQHHPSPQDATFLSDSKLKYDQTFRLLFYPSIVVNGDHLLTGSRQALDLPSVMETAVPAWAGLETLQIENNTLWWNVSVQGTVSVWMLAPTAHQESGKIHPGVAYGHETVDAGEGSLVLNDEQLRENTSFIVLLEQPGRRTLTVASLAPTGPVDVSDGREVLTSPGAGWFDRDVAMVVGLVLVLSLAPAFVIHRELTSGNRTEKAPFNDSEE